MKLLSPREATHSFQLVAVVFSPTTGHRNLPDALHNLRSNIQGGPSLARPIQECKPDPPGKSDDLLETLRMQLQYPGILPIEHCSMLPQCYRITLWNAGKSAE